MPSHSRRDAKTPHGSSRTSSGALQAAEPRLLSMLDSAPRDPILDALFAVKQPAVRSRTSTDVKLARADTIESDPPRLSETPDDSDHRNNSTASATSWPAEQIVENVSTSKGADGEKRPKRKRRRQDDDEPTVSAFMDRLARKRDQLQTPDQDREASPQSVKRSKLDAEGIPIENPIDAAVNPAAASPLLDAEDDESSDMTPLIHETQQQTDQELAKASRTVFIGNVSVDAITSKVHRKMLLAHLSSFIVEDGTTINRGKAAIESIRFRSTPYATAIPKKAAFAKQDLMEATTRTTNAYAVYSSQALAREAARRLNGTIVLGRHIRVDEVAHPAKVDHRRCIFVGNLAFVDDESGANEDEAKGESNRDRGKVAADAEEGLWRTFEKCGKVESVRVVRDGKTRVGKGIAYVQFVDENSVEAALLFNDKKFPPMLPRKLRVSRAKAQKRNAKAASGRSRATKQRSGTYERKLTPGESSNLGRTGRLLGRAAVSQARKQKQPPTRVFSTGTQLPGIKKLENFVAFEGHRARPSEGKKSLKMGTKQVKKRPRSTTRSRAFKNRT